MAENKKLLGIKELSQKIGLSVSTIHRLKNAGKIPFFQPAGKRGRLLFPADAIEQAAASLPPLEEGQAPAADSSKRLSGRMPNWMQPATPNNHE